MKNNKIKSTSTQIGFYLISFIFSLISCTKNEIRKDVTSEKVSQNLFARISGEIPYKEGTNTILGEKKKNPYTIEIMNLAWHNLEIRGIVSKSSAKVYTSHLYVKFAPQNSEEYESLHEDTTLSFSDYPIESEVIQNGDYYHDPTLPDSIPTYQYTAVPIDYKFPEGIKYEILEKLYIPESDPIFKYENGGTEDCFVDKLLNEAYALTGNDEDIIDIDDNSDNLNQRRYTPGGRIRVFDTRLQEWIGMEGVRVQARRWFIWYNGRPDYNGNYRMNHSFKRPCNYSIWFATSTFSVRHNLVNTTFWINGPKILGDWNYDLNNSYQRFAGHVFRGAYRYHAKEIGGLERPWIPFKRQIYVAKDGYKDWSGINWIVLPVIRIARYEDEKSGEYDSDEIFSTTCHETGHTSYVLRMNGGVIQYWQVSRLLQESWPVAIEWYLTNIEYSERGIANYGSYNYNSTNTSQNSTTPQFPNTYAFQYWNGTPNRYTPIFIDIVDDFNQLGISFQFFGTGWIDDRVFGYTIPDIEHKILKHIYGLSSLSQELKANKPYGVTDSDIDLLISYY